MNTNFQMLRILLETYKPFERATLLPQEKELITDTLHIREMDVLAFRNLRDFIVIFLSQKEDMESFDKMSAITYVIDCEIMSKDEEV